MKLSAALVQIALAELGTTEINGTNCGLRVDEYKSATWMENPHQGWPWCAAFVCWCVEQAMLVAGVRETKTFRRPQTAGAYDFQNWSQKQDASTSTARPVRANMIQPGDIVIYNFSHIGIATSGCLASGYFSAIEGNTDKAGSREGGGVFAKTRHVDSVRCRIRFTV